MSISVVCDECDKQLKVADTYAGKKVRCPACKGVVLVPAETEEEPEEEVEEERPARSRRGKPVVKDEDEEEDEPPRSKKKTKAAPVDEDEDEDEEEEEEDPQPKKKTKKKKKKKEKEKSGGGRLLLWLSLGGVSLLALGAGGYFGLAFFMGMWPFTSGLGAELKYLPDDCAFISSERTDELRKTKLYQTQKEKLGGLIDQSRLRGIKDEDIERVTRANSDSGETIVIVRAKKAVTPDEIKEGFKVGTGQFQVKLDFTEESVGNYKLYVAKMVSQSFCVPESKIVLYGPPETLRKVLRRDKKLEMSANLKKAYSGANFSKTDVMIFAGKKGALGIGPGLGGNADDIEAMCIETDHGTTMHYKMTAYCRDGDAAERVLKEAEKDMKGEGVGSSEVDKERRRNAKISKSGSTVHGSTSVKEQTLIDEMNKIMPPRGGQP